jgi:hypothetical protein
MEKRMTEQETLATPVKLELPLGAVNMILAALAKAPYEQVADLVQAIREQAIPQVPMPKEAAPAEQPLIQ